MAHRVIMPKQGLQMTEGTIIEWLVAEGGDCVEGEPLFEMETDKLAITIDAPASGKLLKILHREGETVPITELIAIIGDAGEDISEYLGERVGREPAAAKRENTMPPRPAPVKTVPQTSGRVLISPRARMLVQQHGVDYTDIVGTGAEGAIVERDIRAVLKAGPKVTPLAKKAASMHDIPLDDIQGTGDRGKIVRDDVIARLTDRRKGKRKGEVIPFTGIRRVIAGRMVESLRTAAQATHRIRVDMTESARVRDAFRSEGKKVSYTDFIACAVCRALRDHPAINAEITGEGIWVKDFVNLGVAVAVEKGLIVPVIRDADLLTLEEISVTASELAARAKDGQLPPEDYADGSFTISNLGMYGIYDFTAILNPPESGILAVGKIEKTPVVRDDGICIRPMMILTLTYDHRVVDGAPAARFLASVKRYLEQPYLLL
jgi:pyruvate dehydrogenase E2 component (dihydrolipoamide acetyltransferase)